MDSQSVTLELRQEDNSTISQNGNWEANVAPVTLNDGDTISVYKVFLDTRQTGEGLIVLDEDVTLHYECAHYVCKTRGEYVNPHANGAGFFDANKYGQVGMDNKSVYYYKADTPSPTLDPGTNATGVEDNEPYVSCNTIENTTTGGEVAEQLTTVTCSRYDDGLGGSWGNTNLTIEYTYNGVAGLSQTYHVPEQKYNPFGRLGKKRKSYVESFDIPFPIIHDVGSALTITHPKVKDGGTRERGTYYSDKYNVRFKINGSTSVGGKYIFTPIIRGGSMDIPAGDYTPSALCNLMNTNFQSNRSGLEVDGHLSGVPYTAEPVNNPFLSTSDALPHWTTGIKNFQVADINRKAGVLPFWGTGRSNGRCFGQATSEIGLNAEFGFNDAVNPRLVQQNSIIGGVNIYTGASNVEIDYDADQNNFFFKYLHTPYYGAATGDRAESVALQYSPPLGNGSKKIGAEIIPATTPKTYIDWLPNVPNKKPQVIQVNANSGVVLTKFTASIAGGVEGSSNFVKDVLGFDGSEVATLPIQTNKVLTDLDSGMVEALGNVSYPEWATGNASIYGGPPGPRAFLPGTTMTEGFPATNTAIYLGSPAALPSVADPRAVGADFWIAPDLGNDILNPAGTAPLVPLVSTVSVTRKIVAPNTQDFTSLPFGYYLLELKTNFMNNFITKTPNDDGSGDYADDANMRSINSVIGRFYSKNSFTQSDGGLVYTHKGEPIVLNSFTCKVLNSNKEVPRLGSDNSVILQITRGVPQIPEQTAKK